MFARPEYLFLRGEQHVKRIKNAGWLICGVRPERAESLLSTLAVNWRLDWQLI